MRNVLDLPEGLFGTICPFGEEQKVVELDGGTGSLFELVEIVTLITGGDFPLKVNRLVG